MTAVEAESSLHPGLVTNQDLDPARLRQAWGVFPSGVVAIAAEVDGQVLGLAASSFTSVSLDPPLVSVSLAVTSMTWPALRRAPRLGLTVLAEHHGDLCRQLSGPVESRFDAVAVSVGRHGAVLLDEGIAHFDCEIHEEVIAGDHVLVILRVRGFDHVHEPDGSSPLVFHRSAFTRLAPATGARYKQVARTTQPLVPVLAERWSPRSFAPDHVLDDESLAALAEAARWAPSGSNHQPRRLILGRRGTATFDRLLSTLGGRNRSWAHRASLLVLAVRVDERPDGSPHWHADYDTGQAIAHLVVQAHAMGLVARQMGGFDPHAAAAEFGLEPPLTPRSVTAVGSPGPLHGLDAETIALEREPRARIPLSDFVLLQE